MILQDDNFPDIGGYRHDEALYSAHFTNPEYEENYVPLARYKHKNKSTHELVLSNLNNEEVTFRVTIKNYDSAEESLIEKTRLFSLAPHIVETIPVHVVDRLTLSVTAVDNNDETIESPYSAHIREFYYEEDDDCDPSVNGYCSSTHHDYDLGSSYCRSGSRPGVQDFDPSGDDCQPTPTVLTYASLYEISQGIKDVVYLPVRLSTNSEVGQRQRSVVHIANISASASSYRIALYKSDGTLTAALTNESCSAKLTSLDSNIYQITLKPYETVTCTPQAQASSMFIYPESVGSDSHLSALSAHYIKHNEYVVTALSHSLPTIFNYDNESQQFYSGNEALQSSEQFQLISLNNEPSTLGYAFLSPQGIFNSEIPITALQRKVVTPRTSESNIAVFFGGDFISQHNTYMDNHDSDLFDTFQPDSAAKLLGYHREEPLPEPSPEETPTLTANANYDLNRDGYINILDVWNLRYQIDNSSPVHAEADINGDGVINELDQREIEHYVHNLAEKTVKSIFYAIPSKFEMSTEYQISAKAVYENGEEALLDSRSLLIKSSDSSVITIENDKVISKEPGTATLTVEILENYPPLDTAIISKEMIVSGKTFSVETYDPATQFSESLDYPETFINIDENTGYALLQCSHPAGYYFIDRGGDEHSPNSIILKRDSFVKHNYYDQEAIDALWSLEMPEFDEDQLREQGFSECSLSFSTDRELAISDHGISFSKNTLWLEITYYECIRESGSRASSVPSVYQIDISDSSSPKLKSRRLNARIDNQAGILKQSQRNKVFFFDDKIITRNINTTINQSSFSFDQNGESIEYSRFTPESGWEDLADVEADIRIEKISSSSDSEQSQYNEIYYSDIYFAPSGEPYALALKRTILERGLGLSVSSSFWSINTYSEEDVPTKYQLDLVLLQLTDDEVLKEVKVLETRTHEATSYSSYDVECLNSSGCEDIGSTIERYPDLYAYMSIRDNSFGFGNTAICEGMNAIDGDIISFDYDRRGSIAFVVHLLPDSTYSEDHVYNINRSGGSFSSTDYDNTITYRVTRNLNASAQNLTNSFGSNLKAGLSNILYPRGVEVLFHINGEQTIQKLEPSEESKAPQMPSSYFKAHQTILNFHHKEFQPEIFVPDGLRVSVDGAVGVGKKKDGNEYFFASYSKPDDIKLKRELRKNEHLYHYPSLHNSYWQSYYDNIYGLLSTLRFLEGAQADSSSLYVLPGFGTESLWYDETEIVTPEQSPEINFIPTDAPPELHSVIGDLDGTFFVPFYQEDDAQSTVSSGAITVKQLRLPLYRMPIEVRYDKLAPTFPHILYLNSTSCASSSIANNGLCTID